jgi:hypothetical protein
MKKEKSIESLTRLYSYNITNTSGMLSFCLFVIVFVLSLLTLWAPIALLITWAILLISESISGFQQGAALGTKLTLRRYYDSLPKEQIVYKKIRYFVFRGTRATVMNSLKLASAFFLLGVSIAGIFTLF